jgi:hypothetical protein
VRIGNFADADGLLREIDLLGPITNQQSKVQIALCNIEINIKTLAIGPEEW